MSGTFTVKFIDGSSMTYPREKCEYAWWNVNSGVLWVKDESGCMHMFSPSCWTEVIDDAQ